MCKDNAEGYTKIDNLDAWIIKQIQEYPLLFPNRFYVIDHMFNDYGTGFDWGHEISFPEDGYLYYYETPCVTDWLTITFEEYNKEETERWPGRDYAFNYNHYHLQRNRALNADKLSRVFKPLHQRGYTKDFSEFLHLSTRYSPILNFPDNVAREYWLDMLNMMIYIFSTGKYENEIRVAHDRLVNRVMYNNKRRAR